MDAKARFQVAGKIVEVGEVQTFASGFTKRTVVEETSKNEEYPSPVALTLKKDDCEKADSLRPGDAIEAEGFVEGRKWDGPNGTRYFTDLAAKSIIVTEKAEGGKPEKAESWPELVALGAAWGEDEAAVKARCEAFVRKYAIKDRKVTGGKMLPNEFAAIGKAILADHGGAAPEDIVDGIPDETDEMPF